jgi:hypothetical protein
VEALSTDPRITSEGLYDLACVMSLSAAAVRQDKRLAPGESGLRAEQYATRAVALLVRSRDAGIFRDPATREQFTKDADLDPLRSRDDFRKFVDSLEKK